ncbi:reverse transcriptase family protein [Endozoicomonas arenosclerae]|uniref:reverse transcriptase family protein n=1 Tax=Endozoicomonas arenosclerae TaxID=1633495 RepID=UPI0007851DE8|nr:reverse transcriptase family protein [Endozoicomonas arenosclerae]
MKQRKSKLKIQTKGKSYSLHDSPLYKLKTKRKLASILQHSLPDLKLLCSDEGNYAVFEETKKGSKPREIQKPNPKLEVVHTRIASLLCRIDTPNYLHSGKKGHSNVSNAYAHVNSDNLLTTDVKSFFPATSRRQVFSYFYSIMQCSPDVADMLADLCTYNAHIPTGSRISMPLAYWANVSMFNELQALSLKHSVKMTIYVDDLTFSGKKVNKLFRLCVKRILENYDHAMHPAKTILYRAAQPKLVTGVIVTEGQMKVRNEQHQQLASELDIWKAIKDHPYAAGMKPTSKLLGRLYSMAVIDSRYKSKAVTVRKSTHT